MQQFPNRMGLGMRPPLPSFGQGPSMSALAHQQHMTNTFNQPPPKLTTLFVGSISGGITDAFLNQLLSACGKLKSFKRLITPANKPQGFGFAEYEDPDGALRALAILNGVELPALEVGCANKTLLVKADEKTKNFLDAFQAHRMKTDAEEAAFKKAKDEVGELLKQINQIQADASNNGSGDKEKFVIPPHLHDLQEADLPETQRGLVISEIALFRERSAKREREKSRDLSLATSNMIGSLSAPSGPKQREWGKPQHTHSANDYQANGAVGKQQARDPQAYNKPVNFVKAEGSASPAQERRKLTDEELEADRKEARRRDEENSFRDRERRYEPRERAKIGAIKRAMERESMMKEVEERDRVVIRARLDDWDDDESDELFYTDRARWRTLRSRKLGMEQSQDNESRMFEEREAENLRRESEAFLARQMDEMQALAEEQRKAGMLLDDGAPVKLTVSLNTATTKTDTTETKAAVFAQEEEDEEFKKRKVPLVKLDFSVAEGEKAKERLQKIKESLSKDKETLFKAKVRWDGLTDQLIDRKLEPLIKKLMVKYLGELEDDDLVMFVLEHLKDHKGPQKLVDGLEPVLEEEATELVISLWRQVIFESMAYGEGLHTEKMMIDS